MHGLMQEVEDAYKEKYMLHEIERELDLSIGKVTKIFVTAGVDNFPFLDEAT